MMVIFREMHVWETRQSLLPLLIHGCIYGYKAKSQQTQYK